MFRISKNEKGFTLIEVMLVVIILALIASMVVPRLAGRSKKARSLIAKADILGNLPTALDLYELDNGMYPSTEQGMTALFKKPSGAPVPKNWSGPYLKNPPNDPWKNAYQYRFPGTHNPDGFDLYSYGPDGQEGGDDDITNWAADDETGP